MLSANVPHTAYLTPGFSVSDWIASTRKPRTALDGKGATNCAAEVHAQAGEHAGWLLFLAQTPNRSLGRLARTVKNIWTKSEKRRTIQPGSMITSLFGNEVCEGCKETNAPIPLPYA